MYITGPEFYHRYRIDLRLNTRAEWIDTAHQQILLGNGKRLHYDKLLIATGALPRSLSIDTSAVRDHLFFLRTMADAKAIVKASKGIVNALIVGAGLVGLETAYALQKKGINVTIIAKSNHLLSRNSDIRCAFMIQQQIEKNGVRFLFGRDVKEFSRQNGSIRIKTDQEDEFLVDMIIAGKGVEANLDLVRGTDINI